MRAGYSVVASSGKVLGWAFFLRELCFFMREAFILQPFLSLNTTKIITYGHVHAFKLTPVPKGKTGNVPDARWGTGPACQLFPAGGAAGPQENPEPRFQDEFAAVEVAQFFYVRRRISSDFLR